MPTVYCNTTAESANAVYNPPVYSGLVAWQFFNDSLTKAKHNFAMGKTDHNPVGTITVNSTSANFKGSANYLQTDIPESVEFTYFFVGRTTDTNADSSHNPCFIGTFQSVPADPAIGSSLIFSMSIYSSLAGRLTAAACRGTSIANQGSNPVSLTGLTLSNWGLYCMRVSNTKTELFAVTAGLSGATADTVQPRLLSAGKLRIGSAYSGFGGQCDIAAMALYNRYLSTDEMTLVNARLRAYMAGRGVVV